MSYLVHRPATTGAAEKPVGEIEDQPGLFRHILISMYDAGRHHYRQGPALPDQMNFLVRIARISLLPKNKLKVAGTNETKKIGLSFMLVRTPDNPGQSLTDISHHGVVFLLQSVAPEQLHEPAPFVGMAWKIKENDTLYVGFLG